MIHCDAGRVQASERRQELTLAGPPSVVSFPLIHMVESGALAAFADHVRFEMWSNPDQLRVLVIKKQADIAAVPSNVAANLYNRGAHVRLLNISTWGILWIVSRDKDRFTLPDFQGETIAVPFRGDMPDILFDTLVQEAGLDIRKDFAVRYVASFLDAAQLLLARQIRHALLAEPMVSLVMERSRSLPANAGVADLYRDVSFHVEWGRLFNREKRIPQAGIISIGDCNQELVKAVIDAYASSLEWCQANPEACGALAVKYLGMITVPAAVQAIRSSPMEAIQSSLVKESLSFFYKILLKKNPALIGGKMPDENFYF